MAAVFAIGIAVGLGAAWWTQRAGSATYAEARKPAAVVAAPSPRPASDARGGMVRGISPSELPYDGAPPPAADPVSELPLPPAGVSLPDAFAGQSSGDSGSAAKDRDAPQATNEPDTTVQTERAEPPASSKPPANPVAKTDAIATRKPAADKDATAVQKPRSASRAAKDREIERIRKEADKELQRKLEVGRAAQHDRTRKLQADASRSERRQGVAMRESREARVRKVLAQCNRMRNIFRREQCKWRLCSGMWGKNGCPSYARPASPYHIY